jgi:hypothetical protein
MRIRVEFYSGYRAEERPRRLYIGEQQVEVADILARWLTPEYRYFEVVGDDWERYLIRCPVAGNGWELILIKG